MGIFGLVLVIMLTMITLMAIGVIMGKKPLQGSCGGVGQALRQADYECSVCGNPQQCSEQKNAIQQKR